MMTPETCQGSIPASKTYTQKGYFDPPYRISGTAGPLGVYSPPPVTGVGHSAILGAAVLVGFYFLFSYLGKKSN